jgi:hypothetical protein
LQNWGGKNVKKEKKSPLVVTKTCGPISHLKQQSAHKACYNLVLFTLLSSYSQDGSRFVRTVAVIARHTCECAASVAGRTAYILICAYGKNTISCRHHRKEGAGVTLMLVLSSLPHRKFLGEFLAIEPRQAPTDDPLVSVSYYTSATWAITVVVELSHSSAI